MRNRIIQLVAVGLLMIPTAAMAQTVTTYYYGAPTPIIYTPPTTTLPVTTYYAPTPVRVYSPVYGAPQPIIYGRPTYPFYSPYGGAEIRVPGQPIRNTLRTIIP